MKAFLLLVYTIGSVISAFPQISKLLRTKSADDISAGSWALWLTTATVWCIYVCLYAPEPAAIFMSFLDAGLNLIVLVLSLYYQHSKTAGGRQ